jgi:hypothetical protein
MKHKISSANGMTMLGWTSGSFAPTGSSAGFSATAVLPATAFSSATGAFSCIQTPSSTATPGIVGACRKPTLNVADWVDQAPGDRSDRPISFRYTTKRRSAAERVVG